jgi:hypothetical protein
MTSKDESGRSIENAHEALNDAMEASDTAALGQLLFEGLAFELPDGSIIGRDADLRAHATGATRFERFSELHRTTRESAGRGRVDSLVDVVVIDHGRRLEARLTYRRYWSIIEGRWQVVAGSAALAE